MKIKVISRNPEEFQRETKHDIFKVPRNYSSASDPFRHQLEYTRALNAAKLERILAKPFLAALDGHSEAVHILKKHPERLPVILSGARDGQMKIWHLTTKKCLSTIQAHNGPINGISVDQTNGTKCVTVGQDCQIKVWNLPDNDQKIAESPCHSLAIDGVPHYVSHLANSTDYAICGEGISIWKIHRDSPVRNYNVGPNTVHHIACNPIEEHILAGCSSDRSIFVFDARQKVPLTRLILKLRTNSISWHPLEPFTFTSANEDYNIYTFDIRYLNSAKNVHQGNTSAVIDVDYSPTGKEFVSGCYDRSIRIFSSEESRSREIYHAPRMQNVLSVLWSLDNKYIISGSDDMNIRLWKASAAEKLGPLRPREKRSMEYSQRLRETYQNHPEVKRIIKHRQIPKSIHSAAREHKIIRESQRRKEDNRRKHSKNPEPYISQRVKPIVKSDA